LGFGRARLSEHFLQAGSGWNGGEKLGHRLEPAG
jgi:hypothetical protein